MASEAPSNALGDVVARAVGAVRSWAGEIPPGMAKVAALRDGSEEELPPATQQNLWRHPNAHPAALMFLLLDRYGEEMFDWEPDVLLVTMQRDGIQLSNSNRTKILAARVAMHSPSPWRQWEVFHWVCLGLAGHQPNFHYLEEPEIGHLVAGYDFMKMVDPERDTSDEVDKFVAATFKAEGLQYIPAPLDFAQRELEDPMIRCRNCDAIHRDDNDVRCVTCGSPQLEKVPFEFASVRDETSKLWRDLKSMPLEAAVERAPADTPAGNAVYRLLVQWDYANQVRSHLTGQIHMLSGR